MEITKELIGKLIFNRFRVPRRYTQDSPIFPDVWMKYYEGRGELATYRADLILTPHRKSSAAELFHYLSQYQAGKRSFEADKLGWRLASNGESVAAALTLRELITIILPLTHWWQQALPGKNEVNADILWLMELAGAILMAAENFQFRDSIKEEGLLPQFAQRFRKEYPRVISKTELPLLWSVSRNRSAGLTLERSVPSTKADAGRRLFEIDGTNITWAVLDTGVDAGHPAFRRKDASSSRFFKRPFGPKRDPLSNNTRVIATYDFSRFRDMIAMIHAGGRYHNTVHNKKIIRSTSNKYDESLSSMEMADLIRETERDLKAGRLLDWTVLSPLLRVPHNASEYLPPENSHGTHVAGILGAGPLGSAEVARPVGMCPGLSLYDIRVLNGAGEGDEFNILAAIQFIRWMNNQRDGIVIHGVNISISIPHEVASYACGRTPVCVACERLVSEGVVVVAAAGNQGQALFQDNDGRSEQGFRTVNITDPGNAENVITVGSTHRDQPHTYGVSYFSSKGPTGDGRVKPDLVAPGEKIVSTVIGDGTGRMDGTSMAAPHVSGAAALLMAKHQELIGRPDRIKNVLCKTATDLGREKYFQGCGMLDVLRAIQSV